MIRLEVHDGFDREINRFADGVPIEYLLQFEIVLHEQFRATQAAVHVITRSLKSSGNVSSSHTNSSWEGEIAYGGPSTGIHNPVDYAEYERERDGAHDFLAPAEAMDGEYQKAMMTYLRGY
jgi:hypothetical protein